MPVRWIGIPKYINSGKNAEHLYERQEKCCGFRYYLRLIGCWHYRL